MRSVTRSAPELRLGRCVLLLALVSFVHVSMVSEAEAMACGPGPHWVDSCPAGIDGIPVTTAVVTVDFNLDFTGDLTLNLTGPTTIERDAASDTSSHYPGFGGSSLDAHQDVIDTEIIALSLTGSSVVLTAGTGVTPGGVVLAPSLGVVVEDPGDPTLATSHFELFFEVDLTAIFPGLYLYNHDPHVMEAVIDGVAPAEVHAPPVPGVTLLYDDPVGGSVIAQILSAEHSTVPEPGTATLLGLGLAAVAARRRGARR